MRDLSPLAECSAVHKCACGENCKCNPCLCGKGGNNKSGPSCATRTNLKDKVVLITGASSGIGKATSWKFAAEGARLVLIGRRKARLEDLRTELVSAHPGLRVHIEVLDVTDFERVQRLPDALPCCFKVARMRT